MLFEVAVDGFDEPAVTLRGRAGDEGGGMYFLYGDNQ